MENRFEETIKKSIPDLKQKLEAIKRSTQSAATATKRFHDSTEILKTEVMECLEKAKKIYKNWDSISALLDINISRINASEQETNHSPNQDSQTLTGSSNWEAVKGLFFTKDLPSTNNSSSNQ